MVTRSLRLALGLGLMVLLASPARASLSPMATLKETNGKFNRLLRQKPAAGTPAEKQQKQAIKQLAGSLLDYDELAQRSLGSHWAELSKAKQADFVSTLRELIERNYVRQLRSNLDYQVIYKNESIHADEATVSTVVKVHTEGKTTDAEIVYKLHHRGDEWRVWDVVTDEVSLVRNYRTQFNKIINQKGYDALIKKMKAKLAEGT